jgi:periplasmic protein CpxP/Spy
MNAIKNNKWISAFIISLLAVNIATLVLLWVKTTDKAPALQPIEAPPPKGQLFEFITTQLHLTEAQQKQFEVLREQHHANQNKLVDSIKIAKDNFFNLIKLDTCSNELLKEKNDKISFFQQQLDLVHFNHFKQLRNICNAAQKLLFDQSLQAILKRMANQRPKPRKNEGNRPGANDEENRPPHRLGERPLNEDEPPPEQRN